jgi:hypothetical protein
VRKIDKNPEVGNILGVLFRIRRHAEVRRLPKPGQTKRNLRAPVSHSLCENGSDLM